MIDINCNEEYEKIIKELAKCNCEEDFEDFIVKNERLYYPREDFNWLLNWEENPILKLNRECDFDYFLDEYITQNKNIKQQKNRIKENDNYENNFKKTFYTKFIKNIKKEFLFDKYNLLCLEQIYKKFTNIRSEGDLFTLSDIYNSRIRVFGVNDIMTLDYDKILNKDNKALFLKKDEDVSNNKVYKEIFDRIPNIKKNEILRIIYDIHYYIIELLKVEGLKINKIVIFKDFIFEKYVIDYLLQYDERYKELEKKFLNCFLLNLSNEWNKDRKSLEDNAKTITAKDATIKEQKEKIETKESVKEISDKVQGITDSSLKEYKSRGLKDWNYWFLGGSILVSIVLSLCVYFGWDSKFFNNKVVSDTNKNVAEAINKHAVEPIKKTNIVNKEVMKINNKDSEIANKNSVENVYPLWVKFVFLLKVLAPIFIVGFIAYRNINRNKFLKEEYQHKDTIMRLFNVFRDDKDEKVSENIKEIMFNMLKENPNDNILRNENHHNKWLKKFIKNSQEVLKIYTKNKNGNVKD